MSDPLSITASIVAIATLAYASSKALYEIIKDIQDAPKSFLDLNADLEALQAVLNSLKAELEGNGRDAGLSDTQQSCLRELGPSLQGCSDACDQFKSKLVDIMSHTREGHSSFRDRVKLQFHDKEIAAFRFRLASYKSTLSVALGFASLKNISQNKETTRALEVTINETMNRLSGQMQGMEIGMQAVIDTGAQNQDLMRAIAREAANVAQCLKVCMAALSGTTQNTGNTFKYVRAFDDARQLVGNIGNGPVGGPATTFDVLIAQDRARQMAGNIDGNVALDFMNAPSVQSGGRGVASSGLPMPPMPF